MPALRHLLAEVAAGLRPEDAALGAAAQCLNRIAHRPDRRLPIGRAELPLAQGLALPSKDCAVGKLGDEFGPTFTLTKVGPNSFPA